MSRFELPQPERGDRYVFVIVKGLNRYVFSFDDYSKQECLRRAGQFAGDPDLSFTWYDAAVLTQKVKAIPERTT